MLDIQTFLEIDAYLNKHKLNLKKTELWKLCGFQTFNERNQDAHADLQLKSQCYHNDTRDQAVSIELIPSDRPGEITINTLKRFECVQVEDLDDVQEEGINEEEYFSSYDHDVVLNGDVDILPGHVATVRLDFVEGLNKDADKLHALVFKNSAFGKKESFTIDKQIILVQKLAVPTDNEESLGAIVTYYVNIKILNHTDAKVELKKGDVVAVAKMEMKDDPTKENFETFTTVKHRNNMRRAKEEDDMIRKKEGVSMEIPKSKKKKKKKGKASKKTKGAAVKENEQKKGLSFDLDALDFEPLNSDEELAAKDQKEGETKDVASDEEDPTFSDDEDIEVLRWL